MFGFKQEFIWTLQFHALTRDHLPTSKSKARQDTTSQELPKNLEALWRPRRLYLYLRFSRYYIPHRRPLFAQITHFLTSRRSDDVIPRQETPERRHRKSDEDGINHRRLLLRRKICSSATCYLAVPAAQMAESNQTSILGTHTTAPTPAHPAADNPPRQYTYYHAGPLFTLADLSANTQLASAIAAQSNGKYQAILPQSLEQRDTTPHAIRDADIRALLSCDLALFTYDGAELDSGTVVEYMLAKFADIPAVILRTDFRGAGDQGSGSGDKWNLMSSFYPRTEAVVVDSMVVYKAGLQISLDSGTRDAQADAEAGTYLVQKTAEMVVQALDRVVERPSVLPKVLRPKVYEWLALMPGFKVGGEEENMRDMMGLLMAKEERGLL